MSKNVLQTVIGIGYKPQAALQTASLAADIWRLSKLNAAMSVVSPVNEDDAMEIGKGDEFAHNIFKVNMDCSGSIEKYISSEMMAWLFSMAFGKVTEAAVGTGGFKLTIVPTGVCDPLDLPPFTFVEQIKCPTSDAAVDRASVGNVIDSFTLSLGSGPGRQSGKFSANFSGCGLVNQPSAIVVPGTALAEHLLPASSAAVTILGTNYVTNKNLVSLEFSAQNNVRLAQGFYPGSGVDSNGYAIRGRMERGNRAFGLATVARFDAGSTELTNLLALTIGTAVFELSGAALGTAHHGLKVTFHKAALKTAQLADDQGLVTVATQISPMFDDTDGVITVEVTTGIAGIGQAA